MDTLAVVLAAPGRLTLDTLRLRPLEGERVAVDVEWSGVSAGTERLLVQGRMPPFPGLRYPLVPGYETVGRVAEVAPDASDEARALLGRRVFVPGSDGFEGAAGLFGGAAGRVVAAASRLVPVEESLAERATLLALAATALHAVERSSTLPTLIVGHGALGRLAARLVLALGGTAPVVHETTVERRGGARGYAVLAPDEDESKGHAAILDASGDAGVLDGLIGRLARGGELVLGGFYSDRPSFAFPPAFIKEATLKVAAEWAPQDLARVAAMASSGALSLDGLVSHARPAAQAPAAYDAAFGDPTCLKMILDWRARP